ncbi:GNAT family N-acetyltransferase [Haloactinopolyspora sp.]|uniref:GNAT family N-acetyltransferase n=1 Tax=Haloactinopolyspora sp. TaxID=1966353 RepID=UPI0026114C77|nr:GNAT family N-acetyltransferase [Haloactinopolyspora sp.]
MTDLAALMTRWHAGWTTSRGYRMLGADADSITVHVAYPGREVEHVALADAPGVHAALLDRLTGHPDHWVTLPTSDRQATERLVREAGYVHREPEWLMTRPLAGHPPATSPPDGLELVHSFRAGVHVVEVVTTDGSLAAKGQLAVVGRDAVADRIFTMPSYRRRGLGRLVMGALASAAVSQGAAHGVLIASVDGRALYAALGWQVVADIVIATHPQEQRSQAAP